MESTSFSLAAHLFDWSDQRRFARLSGDRNPMHMDAMAARRTQSGLPVVHGVHAILWSLEELAHTKPLNRPPLQLEVHFHRMIYVGDTVALEIVRRNEAGIHVQLTVDDIIVVVISITFFQETPDMPRILGVDVPAAEWPEKPVEPLLEQLNGKAGSVAFATSATRFSEGLPALAAFLGNQRIAGLAACRA